MTDYEANNHGSLPRSSPVGHSWNWLSERLPAEGAQRLGNWMQGELDLLESTHSDLITARSLKHHLRHEFTASKRSTTEQSQSE